jgi:hypothetical protein
MGRAKYVTFASYARGGALCALIVREHATRPWCREEALLSPSSAIFPASVLRVCDATENASRASSVCPRRS